MNCVVLLDCQLLCGNSEIIRTATPCCAQTNSNLPHHNPTVFITIDSLQLAADTPPQGRRRRNRACRTAPSRRNRQLACFEAKCSKSTQKWDKNRLWTSQSQRNKKKLLKRSRFVDNCLEIARAERTNQRARDELLKCSKSTENTQSQQNVQKTRNIHILSYTRTQLHANSSILLSFHSHFDCLFGTSLVEISTRLSCLM
jgi:hypothetical protein